MIQDKKPEEKFRLLRHHMNGDVLQLFKHAQIVVMLMEGRIKTYGNYVDACTERNLRYLEKEVYDEYVSDVNNIKPSR